MRNPFSRHNERYQRPQNYTVAVPLFTGSGTAVNLAPGGLRTPAKTFLVQADLNNLGVINIGNSMVSLVTGVQLDPGRAWVFSVDTEGFMGSLLPTPVDFADAVNARRDRIVNYQAPENSEIKLYLDIADFWVAGDSPVAQICRVFWFTITKD